MVRISQPMGRISRRIGPNQPGPNQPRSEAATFHLQHYDPPFYIINHQVKVRITHRLVKSCTDYFPLLVTSEVKFRNAAILKTLSQLTYHNNKFHYILITIMDFSDDSDINEQEVNEIRPYMYEPRAVCQQNQSGSDSEFENQQFR